MRRSFLSRASLTRLPLTMVTTVGSNAVIQGSAFLGSVLLVRALGASARGEYAGATSYVLLMTALPDLGVSQALPFYCAKRPLSPGGTIGSGFAYAGITGLLSVAVGIVLLVPYFAARQPGLAHALFVYLFVLPLVRVSSAASGVAQGLGLLRQFNRIRVLQSLAQVGGVVIALGLGGKDAASVLLAAVGLQGLVTLYSVGLVHRHSTASGWRVTRSSLRELLGYGLKTHVGNLSWLVNNRLDQMIMAATIPMAALGIYANAAAYASGLVAVVSALSYIAFPKIASAITREEGALRLGEGLRQTLRLSIVVGVTLIAIAPWIIPFVFGEAFRAAVPSAMVLVVGGALLSFNYMFSVGLRAFDRPLWPSIAEGGGLLVTIIGLPLVLGRYGILGAAWISVLSYCLTLVILVVYYRRWRGESVPRTGDLGAVV